MVETKVAVWRGRGALFWSAALLPICCYLLLAVRSFSITQPYGWLIALVLSLVSLSKWMYLMAVCAVHWMLTSQRIQFFSVSPEVRSSRWDALCSVFQLRRLIHICCSTYGSGFVCWCLLHVIEGHYKNFSKICSDDEEQSCLNEQHLFIVLHAAYLGMIGTISFFSNNQNLIHYPVIQQSKWDQIRGELLSILKDSAAFVLRKLKFYYVIYYLILGHVMKNWIISHLPVHTDVTDRVDSIFGLLDMWLFLTTWITGTLLYFFTQVFSVMYTAYQTQPYEFVVQCNVELDEKKMLVEALACDTYPLLQFQGYQDLCLLAKNSPHRRAQLFSLSSLGGHPYNWLSISAECLSSLSKFYEDVKGHNTKTMTNGSVKHLSGDSSDKGHVSNTADISYRGTDSSLKSTQQESAIKKESKSDMLYKELCKRKPIANLFCPSPESSSRQMLAHAQKYIWNIEALSHLVTASYKEDTYGVVQKSLPEIISNLVTLQEEIEKMMKLSSTISRSGVENDQESALHTRLRATLKSAIYNVGCVFGDHVESIAVPQEVKKRLRQFTDYRI